MTTRTVIARETTETAAPHRIPTDMMVYGFVAVPMGFPDQPTAHRVTHITIDTAGTEPTAIGWTQTPIRRTELRAACQATADSPDRVYELSAPMADHRGAIACDDPACFGGAR